MTFMLIRNRKDRDTIHQSIDILNKSPKEIDKNLQKHLLKSYQYVIIYPNGIELILILAEGEV